MDLRSVGVHAYDVQQVLEEMGVNVNAVALPWEHGDKMSGLRLGTAALTSRSMSDFDMDIVAEFLHQGLFSILLYVKVLTLALAWGIIS